MQVQALERLDLNGLREAWRHRYGAPPALRSCELLRLMLAWRLQAEVLGGLDAQLRRRLRAKGQTAAEGLSLGAGAILRREWKGRVMVVTVTEDGFLWEGSCYRSLTAVATAIAGVKWNGPRFFGLRDVAA